MSPLLMAAGENNWAAAKARSLARKVVSNVGLGNMAHRNCISLWLQFTGVHKGPK